MDGKLATGIIGTSFGLDGYVKVHPYSDDRGHCLSLTDVLLAKGTVKRNARIDGCRMAKDCVLIHFAGFDSPEAARALNGFVIWVDRSQAAPLGEGEYYLSDLNGMDVICQGRKVGKVVSNVDGPQGVMLEVRADDSNHFIPFIDRYFGNIDFAGRTVELLNGTLLT